MTNVELLVDVVEGALELAGIPAPVVDVLGASVVDLTDWIGAELAGGRDPAAQLKALMNSADVAAKALEAAELGT